MNKLTAYHEWLGIPLKNEPPNYYEILGIPLFETNTNVISNGAARRISFLQTMVAGEFAELAQEIQKEAAQAKLCLMRESSRTVYQHQLMQKISASSPANKKQVAESTFSVAIDLESSSIDVFVDETRNFNRKLSQQLVWLIGSSQDCDLVIKNQFVSRKHCLLFRHNDQFELEDWASTNGTFVNDTMLSPRVRTTIAKRDIVTLGKVTLMPWPPVDDHLETMVLPADKSAAN